MRRLITMVLTMSISSIVYAQEIEIKTGWQNIGATEDLNITKFDNSCVEYIWRYDNTDLYNPQWKIHIANGQTYEYNGEFISSIKKGDGIGVYGNSSCSVDAKFQDVNLSSEQYGKCVEATDSFGNPTGSYVDENGIVVEYYLPKKIGEFE